MIGNRIFVSREELEQVLSDPDAQEFPLTWGDCNEKGKNAPVYSKRAS